ncbi:hypothetical protein Ais01nite_53900 [Asanoa ishikariensis]|uniref:Immunity protein 21 n=1 Tax=Asanoa ishikariensis TaxID=137265 RepID=A0A1H3TR45_9ACTN|nr:hypothetical protein [Asanoa ishikariensis]GIF67355.1 hypothetical protein Ais01nite_53900 [Asanoa ishikariensis]SDZ52773.1 hypothetical protein SAMN05421684_6253 [Asanoa ishikariensis]
MSDELRLFADYYQIHVFDEGSTSDLGEAWTDDTDMLAVAEDAVAVGTVVNVWVRVAVEVLERSPVDDSADFDDVAEASIEVRSGRLIVMGCTDYEPEATRFPVPPGWLRVRVAKSNLEVARRLDLDSDDDPATMERLRIQVWPMAAVPVVVVKRWSQAG